MYKYLKNRHTKMYNYYNSKTSGHKITQDLVSMLLKSVNPLT